MTTLRISLVDFLNARPLTWGLLHQPPPGVSVSRDVPSECADKLARGEADVGLIPSIEYQRIPGLRVIPGLGIAASSEVRARHKESPAPTTMAPAQVAANRASSATKPMVIVRSSSAPTPYAKP
jgi:chorismate dehydratase